MIGEVFSATKERMDLGKALCHELLRLEVGGEFFNGEARAFHTDPAIAQRTIFWASDDTPETRSESTGHVVFQRDPELQLYLDRDIPQGDVHAVRAAADSSNLRVGAELFHFLFQQFDDIAMVTGTAIVGGESGIHAEVEESLVTNQQRFSASSQQNF